MTTAYAAGLRASEVAGLRVADIDSARGVILVRHGKGAKDRNVMLSAQLLGILRAYWRLARPTIYLFPGRDKEHPIDPTVLHAACRSAVKAAGLTKRVTLHTLRHSFATHLLESGTDIRIIQVLLGHNNLSSTARHTQVAIYLAFNVVSEALEAATISALCRIWDKTGDPGRITEIEKLLRRRPDLAGDNGALRRWLGGVEMVEKSEELQALRAVRNMPLAHTHDTNRPDPRLRSGTRKAVNEDELLLLEATILVVQQLHSLIGSPDSPDYRAEREAWRARAESFWKAIGGALV